MLLSSAGLLECSGHGENVDESQKKERVVFVLPSVKSRPVGGYKMVFEYANRFAADGYNVAVVFMYSPSFAPSKHGFIYRLLRFAYRMMLFASNKIRSGFVKVPSWFDLDPSVETEVAFGLKGAKALRGAGCRVVATAVGTSYPVSASLSLGQKGYYFVQDFEDWSAPESYVLASYRLPLKKITIAPWLVRKIGEELNEAAPLEDGAGATLVENGLDFEYFKMTKEIEARPPYEVAMLYHTAPHKGCDDAFEALKIVKQKVPQLHVAVFGAYRPPHLPEWFSYTRCPSKEEHNGIYNGAAIFVAPSRLEGMGLTPAEAMICGCAVACTDNPGFEVFSRDGETTLVSKVGDVEGLAANIIKLIEDSRLRIKIARQGNEFIRQFTWERAYAKFKAALDLD